MANNIEIFISYADEDEKSLQDLESQLKSLARNAPIDIWYKRKVIAGQDLQQETDRHLKAACIILLLISSNYLASDDSYDEMQLPPILLQLPPYLRLHLLHRRIRRISITGS